MHVQRRQYAYEVVQRPRFRIEDPPHGSGPELDDIDDGDDDVADDDDPDEDDELDEVDHAEEDDEGSERRELKRILVPAFG